MILKNRYMAIAATLVLGVSVTSVQVGLDDVTATPGPTGGFVVVGITGSTGFEVPVCASNGTLDDAGQLGTCVTPPTGPTGPTGPAGPTGADGVSGYERVVGNTSNNTTGAKERDVSCPSGKVVVGGGGRILNAAAHLTKSFPPNSTTWRVRSTSSNNPHTLTAYAICMDAPD